MSITINGTTGIAGVDGSASTPAIQGNDTNTGMFFPAADTIAFAEGGTEVARFDSSGNLLVNTATNTNNSRIVSNGVIESTSGGVRFPDGTTQTTAAGALTTTAVLNAYAGASAGAVGTYVTVVNQSPVGNVAIGATVAGSNLRGQDASGAVGGVGFSGTWRNMGCSVYSSPGYSSNPLFLRIS